MKRVFGSINLLLIFMLVFNSCGQKDVFLDLEGPYLGQKPPGKEAELFAPGIISTKNSNEALLYGFLDQGKVFSFTRSTPGDTGQIYYSIYVTELKNEKWTEPYLTTFHNEPIDYTLPLIPDEMTLYFGSRRSLDGKGESPDSFNIWMVKKTVDGFSKPRMLNPPINSADFETCATVSKNGTIYFFSERSGGLGKADIYRSKLINGKYGTIENLGEPVNTKNSEIDPYIAPDESSLIFCSKERDGFGGHDLYISFRKQDNAWTEPVNLGKEINSSSNDWIPFVTSDGKYFFFTSNRAGNEDIYWVDATIIENLRSKEMK